MPVAIGAILTSIGSAIGSAMGSLGVVIGTLFLFKTLLVGLTSLLAIGIDSVLSISIVNNAVVLQGWGIVRNFANMFFIIALIIMAFSTIFSISKYDFRSLIARFLIAALLINFSLVIGELIIDWTQSLSNIFLQATGSIGTRIAQSTSIAEQVAGTFEQAAQIGNTGSAVDTTLWEETISFVGNIGLLAIIALSMAVFFVTLVVRVFALWALLIVAPIAWLAYITPQTNHLSQRWWRYFIGWNIFLPIYLFFIYFGLLFLSRQNEILAGISAESDSGLGITFKSLFFFLLVAVFFIGGAKVAMRSSISAGAGGVAAWAWGKGRTMARFAGSNMPFAVYRSGGKWGIASRRDISGAAGARWKQAKEEGVRIPGTQMRMFGEQQRRERGAKFGTMLGVRGSDLGMQREFLSKTEKEFKNLQDQYDVRKIDEDGLIGGAKGSASDPRIYAHRKMLAKLGKLDKDTYKATLQELSNNPLAAQDFARTAKESKYSNLEGKDLIEMTTALDKDGNRVYPELDLGNLIPAKKEQARFIQSDEILRSKLAQGQFDSLIGILGGDTTSDGKNLIKDVEEIRPDLSLGYGLAHSDYRSKLIERYGIEFAGLNKEEVDKVISQRHYERAVATSEESLAKMPTNIWKNEDFKTALRSNLSNLKDQTRRRSMGRISLYLNRVKDAKERAARLKVFAEIEKDLLAKPGKA